MKRGGDVTVKIPGKIMLAGEYAVLGGGPALAVTIDRHMTVQAQRLPTAEGVVVASSLWDEPRRTSAGAATTGDALTDTAAHGAALFGVPDVAIRVDSELDVRHGTGSSSALRLGTLLAIEELARLASGAPAERPRDEMWPTARTAYLLQKQAQSAASGYDVATQLVGGLVRFTLGDSDQTWPGRATPVGAAAANRLATLVHVYVGGAGAPTKTVLGTTRAWLGEGDRNARLRAASDALVAAIEETLATPDTGNIRKLVHAAAAQRRALEESPAFPRDLARDLAAVDGLDDTWTFKTTGAGGEDALLLFGTLDATSDAARALRRLGWHRLEAGFETSGSSGTRVTRRTAHG